MKLKTFKFKKVQAGFWGEHVKRHITVYANTQEEAEQIVAARPDYYRRLANGDYVTYRSLTETDA